MAQIPYDTVVRLAEQLSPEEQQVLIDHLREIAAQRQLSSEEWDSWVAKLATEGDPFERRGVGEYSLGQSFPKYAELWAKYVVSNRDKADSSKLRSDLDPDLRDIFYNHYGVFYHLVLAYDHLKNITGPLADIAPPFYHLASVIDFTERTFIAALRAKGDLKLERLQKAEFELRVKAFWDKDYAEDLKSFAKTYRPVKIDLLSIKDIFEQYVQNSQQSKAFKEIRKPISRYRNVLTHSLPPLIRVTRDGKIFIPKADKLKDYESARWSSEWNNANDDDYALAKDIIGDFAGKLAASLNVLWDILLELLIEIPSKKFPNSIQYNYPDIDWKQGKATPTNPSGYKVENNGDPLS